MKIKRLKELIEEQPDCIHRWRGKCCDCGREVTVEAVLKEDGIHIEGGAVFEPERNRFFVKCDDCYARNKMLTDYQACEVFARVVGYYRPVQNWNDGKKAEFSDRADFNLPSPDEPDNFLMLHE